ncbi:hypothetical protein [Adonisia turfae]|uniref:Uncharacterized protein n=1 Tax=Adonisia turfae CCMR0081 TaxID=2292702 RepID=A0A6M0RR35_9CYAN|nr:hypothetical protein [Adonisia turfae]NEZ58707.1 hypothetical protein [Adonisia turfae CCMR0081]
MTTKKRSLLLAVSCTALSLATSLPVRANPTENIINDINVGDVLEKCDDIVANEVADTLIENRYNTSSEEAMRSANQFKSGYQRTTNTGGGWGPFKVNRENSSSGNNEGSNEDLTNSKKKVFQEGIFHGKTINPTAVGKDCKAAVNAYNGIVTALFSHLTAIQTSQDQVTIALGTSQDQVTIALGQQDVEKYALETERKALEMQANLAKQQMRAQRLDQLLGPFNDMLKTSMAPRPQAPSSVYSSPGWPQPQPQPQPQSPPISPAMQELLKLLQ